eukprot:109825-Prymnesium_polylepis.1
MTLLDPDAFLTQLTRILEKSRGNGTLYVTMKRCAPHPAHSSPWRLAPACPPSARSKGVRHVPTPRELISPPCPRALRRRGQGGQDRR